MCGGEGEGAFRDSYFYIVHIVGDKIKTSSLF